MDFLHAKGYGRLYGTLAKHMIGSGKISSRSRRGPRIFLPDFVYWAMTLDAEPAPHAVTHASHPRHSPPGRTLAPPGILSGRCNPDRQPFPRGGYNVNSSVRRPVINLGLRRSAASGLRSCWSTSGRFLSSARGLVRCSTRHSRRKMPGALHHARAMGFPVAFVRWSGRSPFFNPARSLPSGSRTRADRSDMIFERDRPSCMRASPSPRSWRTAAAPMVLAGFAGEIACLSTAIEHSISDIGTPISATLRKSRAKQLPHRRTSIFGCGVGSLYGRARNGRLGSPPPRPTNVQWRGEYETDLSVSKHSALLSDSID